MTSRDFRSGAGNDPAAVPSAAQRERFKALAGYPLPQGEAAGSFSTDRPYDADDWENSPWWVKFRYDAERGLLFAELSHRMTNNRCHGWDANGQDLPLEIVEDVFPSSLF